MASFYCASPCVRRANAWPRMMLPAALFAVIVLLVFVGCGKRPGDRGRLYPAEGQVFLDKEPLAGALVVLYPQGLSDTEAVPSRAQTGPDGRFHVGTYDADDGAPEGEYAVTIVSYPVRPGEAGAGPNALPKKYARPKTTDLRVKIGKDAATLPALVLRDERQRANAQEQAIGRQVYR